MGEAPVAIDTSVFPASPGPDADIIPAAVVAREAGHAQAELPELGRAGAVAVMAEGAAGILAGMQARGEVAALVCMGGSNAASVFARLAPVLPLGIPKIILATAVAGDTRPMLGAEDVIMLYPVVDVEGSNAVLAAMIDRLARVALATRRTTPVERDARKTVALSMYGVTTPCVQLLVRRLRAAGREPLVFHANGTGGRSIESFAATGRVDAVLEVTLAEIGNELLGGAFPAGPDRLRNAAVAGIPQVIAPGAIDMIAFGPRPTVPERFAGHRILAHNELVTLVRTTREECRAIGERVAERLGRPAAPAVLCIPEGGTSMLDREGAPFHDPAAVAAFGAGFAARAGPGVEVVSSPHHINDPEFAELLLARLDRLLPA